MLANAAKWLWRNFIAAIIWVFIFSLTINERTLFSYAHEYLIRNTVVTTIDSELSAIWTKLASATKLTFSKVKKNDQDNG